MKDGLCTRIVRSFGGNWVTIGWTLFLMRFFLVLFLPATFWGGCIGGFCATMLLWWWIVDLIDQRKPLWMPVLVFFLLETGVIPFHYSASLSAWFLYWLLIRD